MRKIITILSLCLIVIFSIFPTISHAKDNKSYNILYLNSYHKGYKWSDDILEGIESRFDLDQRKIKVDVEYMDTRRVTQPQYLETLKEIYNYKFSNSKYDLIISSDDKAYQFLVKYGSSLFPDTPIVFCGVNSLTESMQHHNAMMTGIIEAIDIDSTIELALTLHPEIHNVYYVNDTTITGLSIEKGLEKTIERYRDRLNFIKLTGNNLESMLKKEKDIPHDSILLFLIYFKDNEGNLFNYAESIKKISENSPVPIYGAWDFHLGNGIIGGMLTSGYHQGATAAELALRILSGEKAQDIPITAENTNQFKFDYKLLQKYGISLSDIPKNSYVVNHNVSKQKNILILNSYHRGLQWTEDIEKGIKQALGNELDNIEFSYEYMDVKRHSDPISLHSIRTYLSQKYKDTNFDAVVVTDDHAYQLALDYNHQIFNNTPIIFSGVNYFDQSQLNGHKNITGVVEKNHYKETLDLILQLHPDLKRIVVINDATLTGQKNRKYLETLLPQYTDKVGFDFWSNLNMVDIQRNVRNLGKDSVIFLLSFNQDKSFNNFTYSESIELIAENASVPIYGLWDFYLDHGLLGGKLTSGVVQGEFVGDMIKQILSGMSPDHIPVVQENTGIYIFDNNMLEQHNINPNLLPRDSTLINKPFSLAEAYKNNQAAFITIVLLLCTVVFLFFIVTLLLRTNKIKRIMVEQERRYATTDMLTGTPNRRACFECLNQCVEDNQKSGAPLSIAFIDVNRLKYVNDTFGHSEGDELIKNICNIIQNQLNSGEKLCRMGGDEFLIIFNNIAPEDVCHTWTKIQNGFELFNMMQKKPYETSVSVGVIEYDPTQFKNIDDLIDQADSRMYTNKISYRKKNKLPTREKNR